MPQHGRVGCSIRCRVTWIRTRELPAPDGTRTTGLLHYPKKESSSTFHLTYSRGTMHDRDSLGIGLIDLHASSLITQPRSILMHGHQKSNTTTPPSLHRLAKTSRTIPPSTSLPCSVSPELLSGAALFRRGQLLTMDF